MLIQDTMFPSDPDGSLGNLRTSLVHALQRADSNEGAAKLLASTLGFAGSVLRKIYKEDDIKSNAQLKREEDARKEAKEGLRKTAIMVAEAKKGLAGKMAAKAAFYALDVVKASVKDVVEDKVEGTKSKDKVFKFKSESNK